VNIPKSYTVFRALMGSMVLVIGIVVAVILVPHVIQLVAW
jgi:hypothetical protein